MSEAQSLNENPGCLFGLFGRKKAKKSDETVDSKLPNPLPYRLKGLLSPAEYQFYQQAREILRGKYLICPKIALAELLEITSSDKNIQQIAFNKISRKRVDFVVCDADSMQPVYAIELDDSSHERPDRQERDDFVNHAFAAAGLPLVHVAYRREYNHQELAADLLAPLQTIHSYANLPTTPEENNPPVTEPVVTAPARAFHPAEASPSPAQEQKQVKCTHCGAPMRKIAASAGPHKGDYYWVCSNYPKKCKNFFPAGEHVTEKHDSQV
jgi:hypothetical protein